MTLKENNFQVKFKSKHPYTKVHYTYKIGFRYQRIKIKSTKSFPKIQPKKNIVADNFYKQRVFGNLKIKLIKSAKNTRKI